MHTKDIILNRQCYFTLPCLQSSLPPSGSVCVCAEVWGGPTNYISEIALHERHVHHINLKVLSVLEPIHVLESKGM